MTHRPALPATPRTSPPFEFLDSTRYELVPTETAARIRERDERAVIVCGVARDSAATNDDGYENFVVPEDLKW